MKRCSRGTRRNKKTGLCESNTRLRQIKRCPNGSRRNKSGECIKSKSQNKNKHNKTKRTLFDYYTAQTVGRGKKAAHLKVKVRD